MTHLLLFLGFVLPPPSTPGCPTHGECMVAEHLCERTPARNWKPCRKVVAACFRNAERCWGSWSY